ncbi:transporter [Rufibacter soli]
MKSLSLCLLVWLPLPVLAQLPPDSTQKTSVPFVSDRPDRTESATVQALGTLQIESGFSRQISRMEGQKYTEVLYPTTLVRWGVLDQLEVRLATDYLRTTIQEEKGPVTAKGLTAFSIGTKIKVTEENGLLPSIAFLAHLTVPSGSSEFRPAHVAPDFAFSLSHTLSNRFSLGYNLGYAWDGDSPEGTGFYTLSICSALSDRWGGFAEVYGEKPEQGKWGHSTDMGLTFLLRPNLQLDASAGIGITSNAPDYFLSTGFCVRIPR